MIGRLSLVISFAVATSGCTGTTEARSDAWGVWSDDGTRVLVQRWRYTTYRHADLTEYSNFQFELILADPNGSDRSVLRPLGDGQVAEAPFFMRTAGYVLVRYREGTGDPPDAPIRTERISLSDGEVSVISRDTTISYVPTPDGLTLARIRFVECSEIIPEHGTCDFEIGFQDASTLAEVGEARRITFSGRLFGIRPAAVWSPDRELFVWDEALQTRVALRPDALRMVTEVPTCTSPATSSSAVRRDGTLVEARIDDGQVVVDLTDGTDPGWPEKCFGEPAAP